ncbi:Holliday junction branch migration protein RuvA [Corynebacterium cystitidis]|uniref:Holliday junction branch migration protein RuvA n=1 Tax=Corynebacterium cystitidis TaxID=35757 RepID=UPI00211E04F5|nr:Holliday junction branch migration protein RuvA [Corynebacterium cystitidis]
MIDSLHGEVLTIGLDHAVIECGGVGYRFLATPPTLSRLTRGETTRVLTFLSVREDAMTLYGFMEDDDRTMFHTLQTVSGLGPKLALASLSVYNAAEIVQHITGEDTKGLQAIPGVGKRMAERMIVELKDKLQGLFSGAESPGSGAVPAGSSSAVVDQVVEALVGLGFTDKQARPVVEQVAEAEKNTDTTTVLRTSLSQLGKK